MTVEKRAAEREELDEPGASPPGLVALFQKHQVVLWGGLFLLVTVAILFLADSRMPALLATTDYQNSYYVAGHMVRSGLADGLYPAPQAESFRPAFFNVYAHALLPDLPEETVCLFMYPPVAACLFAPLSLLSPVQSLVVWQILSLLAVAASAACLVSVSGNGKDWLKVFLGAFLLFPVAQVLLIGQSTLAFGLLPLCAGYALWHRGSFFRSGLVFSLSLLKPQALVVCPLLAGGLILASLPRRDKGTETGGSAAQVFPLVAGMLAGTAALLLLPTLTLGWEPLFAWLRSLPLVSKTMGAADSYAWAPHLMSSLPGALLVCLPPQWRDVARLPVALVGIVMLVPAVLLIRRLALSSWERSAQRDAMMVAALLFVPMISPYLRLYDLCLLLLPAWIVFFRWQGETPLGVTAVMPARVLWGAVNAYFVFVLIPRHGPTEPWLALLVSIIAAVVWRFGTAVVELTAPAPAPPDKL